MLYPKKLATLAFAAIIGPALTIGLSLAYAQKHGGGGHGGGHSSSEADHAESGHTGGKGKGGPGGQATGHGRGSSGQSLRDVFHSLESGSATDHSSATSDEQGGSKGGSATTSRGTRGTGATTTRGKKGSTTAGIRGDKTTPTAAEEEESDRPAWAGVPGRESKPGRGNAETGVKKGDVYGDMYVILRDVNGVPILNANGFVQPIDANGGALEQDAEGNLLNPDAAIPVDLGRLSVSRAPASVLTSQLNEAVRTINAADAISLDAAGRLVLTKDGVSSAIDSPLANLALYKSVMTTGTIPDLTDATKSKLTSSTNPVLVALGTGGVTTADLSAAASFLGAASDKTIKVTVDSVVNINTILGINTKTDTGTTSYYDYSSFSFDPKAVYGTSTVNVLTPQEATLADGTKTTAYVPTQANVYDALFQNQTTTLNNISAFTVAADDARAVIEYVHDNSAPEGE